MMALKVLVVVLPAQSEIDSHGLNPPQAATMTESFATKDMMMLLLLFVWVDWVDLGFGFVIVLVWVGWCWLGM
jgi:hypothetical protein